MIIATSAYNNDYATVRVNADEGRVKEIFLSEAISAVEIVQIRICKRHDIKMEAIIF